MSLISALTRLGRVLARSGMAALLDRSPTDQGRRHSAGSASVRRQAEARQNRSRPAAGYLGDWQGPVPASAWAAVEDAEPDPGEVVWAWVPFEEDHRQGKDRPVLIVARHPDEPDVYLALPLTSKDHDRDAAQEARAGRRWMDVGSGPWDRSGRPSEVRLNRVLQLRRTEIRRIGAALDREVYSAVLDAVN